MQRYIYIGILIIGGSLPTHSEGAMHLCVHGQSPYFPSAPNPTLYSEFHWTYDDSIWTSWVVVTSAFFFGSTLYDGVNVWGIPYQQAGQGPGHTLINPPASGLWELDSWTEMWGFDPQLAAYRLMAMEFCDGPITGNVQTQ